MKRHLLLVAIICAALVPAVGRSEDKPAGSPRLTWKEAGMDPAIEGRIEKAVMPEIDRGNMSGCAVLIGRREGIVFEHAYGNRQVEPSVEPMTIDTLFDMASRTLTQYLDVGQKRLLLVH